MFDSDHPKIKALKAYEKALKHPEDEQAMQKALTQMDDLKAWEHEARAKEILTKLNITDLDQPVNFLSGGQRKRLALAKLILEEPEFVILDEPTNHLDLDMIEWLEDYLIQSKQTLLMVTHDRYFLDRVCNIIVELDEGNLYRYRGSYTDFLEKKSARHENEAVVQDKRKKLYKRELEWVRRMPKARGTKAKARVDNFSEIKEAAFKQRSADEVRIDIKGARLGSKILEAHYVSKSYDEFIAVKDFDYKFKKKERAGIVGPNGVGKTTFLRLLTQEIRPTAGKIVVGGTVVFGYYSQAGIQLLEDKRVIDVVRDVAEYIPLEKGQKLTAEQLLERFLFPRPQQQVYASQLSGGERRRLYLLTVLMQNPNFLILDEPTNDLDIITLNVLEEFLMDFPGCVLIVSHDRYFMDKLVDHLFVFQGEGKIKDFPGNYTEYRVWEKKKTQEERREASAQKPAEKKQVIKSKAPSNLTYEQRKELKRLEKSITKLEQKKEEITAQFNDTSLSPDQIESLSVQLGEIQDELEEKEFRWMELAELE